MRRTLPFVVLWFAAGALAAAVATAGVSVVDDQLTGSRPDPLSAQEVAEEAAASSATSPAAGPGSTTSTTAASTTSVPPGGSGGDGGTSRPTDATIGSSSPATTTSTTVAPSFVTRTYDLVGGTATIRFSSTEVTVLAASPSPGFTVDVGGSHDGGARVDFESDDHRSRLDTWWDGGPRDEVREEG